MTNLRKLARGQPCMIRVPSVCIDDDRHETTVLCHVRSIGISGYGLKAPDLIASLGCQACHDFVDNRSHPNNTYEYRRLLLLDGMARTLYHWIKTGVIDG